MKKLVTILLALFVLSACGAEEVKMTFEKINESDNVASLLLVPDYEGRTLDVVYRNSETAPETKGQLSEEYFVRFEEIAEQLEEEALPIEADMSFTATLNKDGETYADEASDFKSFYDEVIDLLTQAEPV